MARKQRHKQFKLSERWLQQSFSSHILVPTASPRGHTCTEIQFRWKLRGVVRSVSFCLCDDVIVYPTLGVWRRGGGVSPALKMVGVYWRVTGWIRLAVRGPAFLIGNAQQSVRFICRFWVFAQRVVSAENRFLNTRLLILCDSCGVATSRRLSAVLVDDRPGGIREYDNRTDRKWQPIVVR